jgi:phosphoribosyl-AMP cyclohydrolase
VQSGEQKMLDKKNTEETLDFTPKFGTNGLIPVIAQDAKTGHVLMFAYMNKESLDLTLKTGCAVYYSRSRKKLWKKGEQSGHIQKVEQILVDCDQDCLVLKVSVDAGQCHLGYQSCFYRRVDPDDPKKLTLIAEKVFDPEAAYN